MEYRLLGRTGLEVSPLCLGAMMFGAWGNPDHEDSIRVIHAALDAGINFVDTADVYSGGESEEIVAKALAGRRDDIVLATKFHFRFGDGPNRGGNSRRWIFQEVEASLKRLNTDYMDLYQIHFPDPETPQEETLGALNDLVRAGKVRYIGSSNFAGYQVADAAWISKTRGYAPYISAQNQYNLLDRRIEKDLTPACAQFGVGILPYFPLASGFLTGKYKRGEEPSKDTRLGAMGAMAKSALTDSNFATLDKLQEFARSHGHSVLELAMGWLASMPQVSSVISGATKPEQVSANVKAGDWKLSAEELAEVDKITKR